LASTTAFASMTPYATTGNLVHTSPLSGLTNGISYTYYVRCKDTSNNISPVTTIAFSVATPASPVVTLSAVPTTVVSGNSSTLTGTSSNATSCTASNGWSGAKALSGTQTLTNLTTTATYTLTCTG